MRRNGIDTALANDPLTPPSSGTESQPAPKPPLIGRVAFLIGGWSFLLLAWIGVFFPVLPTAPFVVFASFCFGYSSPRLCAWLEQSQYFGEFIRNYRTKEGISQKTKRRALTWLYLTLGVSLYLSSDARVQLVLLLVAFFVSWHICSLCREES